MKKKGFGESSKVINITIDPDGATLLLIGVWFLTYLIDKLSVSKYLLLWLSRIQIVGAFRFHNTWYITCSCSQVICLYIV